VVTAVLSEAGTLVSGTETATFLFCDLVDSTRMLTRLGDDAGDEIRRECYEVFREALITHGGSRVKSTGDGVLAVFAASVRDAVACGITMQRGLAGLDRAHPRLGLGLRVGIAVGEAKAEDGDWYGTPVVEAARLCAAAHAGQILVADVVRTVAGTRGGYSFRSVGILDLKGLAQPVAACEVDWSLLPAQGGGTELFVLGALEASRDWRPLELGGRRQRAVLASLLLHADQLVSTDRLIEEVWSDAAPPTALTTLRSYLSRLRSILETEGTPALVCGPAGYELRLRPDQLDAHRFERLAGAGRAALARGDPEVAAGTLRSALALWRGPAYADVGDRPFAQAEVTRLEELRLRTLEDRIEADLARGRHEALGGELEALVARHPLRERLWGQLMVALYRAGRETEALDTSQRARRVLAEGLGREPGESLRQLERSVLAHDLPSVPDAEPAAPRVLIEQPTPAVPLPSVVTAARRGLFVGRELEVNRLARAWAEAKAGWRQVVLLAGEPGIGKSRLAAELAALAHEEGAVVLWGRCDEGLGVAYQPVVEALRHYVKHCPDETLVAQLGRSRAQLARLVPELAQGRSDLVVPALDAEAERLWLFEAVSDLLGSAARSRPLLLVLDDLQWATIPTLSLVRHLARAAEDRVLIVAPYRDTEFDPGHPLVDMLADLRREPGVARVAVEGLDEKAVAAFVEAAAGHALDDVALDLAMALHAETQGNPFFAGQVLRHLVETRALDQSDRGWTTTLAAARLSVPEGVREVIGRRLARLPDSPRRALGVAAIIGRDFSVSTLERIPEAGGDADVLLGALEEAARARVVHEVSGKPGRFEFVHDLVRRTLYEMPSEPRRAQLHRRVGEALAGLPGADTQPAVLARHFVAGAAAGCRAEAVAWSERAGTRAVEQFAYEEALTHFQGAIELLDWDHLPDRAIRARLLLAKARAGGSVGDASGGKDAAARAAQDALAVGSTELLAEAAKARAWFVRAGVADPVAAQLLEDGLAAADEHDLSRRASLLGMLAYYRAVSESDGADAERLAGEALALARGGGDPEVLADVLGLRSWVWVLQGSPNVAAQEAVLAELATLLQAGKNWRYGSHAWVKQTRGVIRLQLGDLAGFDAHLEGLYLRYDEVPDRLLLAVAAMWRGLRALLDGRFGEVEDHIADMLRLSGDNANFAASHAVLLFYLRRDQGRLNELKPAFLAVVGQKPSLVGLRGALGLLHSDLDEPQAAGPLLEEIVSEGVAGNPRGLAWPATLAALAEVCARLGATQHVDELTAALEPYSGQLLVVSWGVACIGAADRYLAMLAATAGQLAEAERRFEGALALEQSVSSAPLAARTRVSHARALLDLGDRDDARRAAQQLDAATHTAQRLAMWGLLRDIEVLRGAGPARG
jgi:DNA-binding SARP family transcriptional activator/class 3 adenylate cyclase/tetratricopeptide (TPR) repeat protein